MSSNPVVRIESIEPQTICQNEPFRATWTIESPTGFDEKSVSITFLTDDARLLLCDHASNETPPEKIIPIPPGGRVSKSSTLHVTMRKGLHNEHSRDGSPAPLTLHARVHTENDRHLAISEGYQVWVDDLAKRPKTKIFV